jgi:hypothetical protein
MSKVVAAAITLLFVAGALVPLPGGALADRADVEQASASADAETPTIEQSIRLHLTPSEAGRIDVTVTYDVPEELTSLRVQLPDGATDVTSESFTESSDGYEWDGDTDPAELRFTIPANRSSTGAHSDGPRERDVAGRSTQDTYSFVDAGSWALVTVPQLGTEWSWRNARDVTLTEDVAVDGEGSTGGEMAYLGSVEVHTRTANGQTFTLAVPERASMSESPGDVLDALSVASNQLRVGERDAEIWITAAPRDAEWIAQGIEYGGSDFWVVANAPLDVPGNVWLHEYVHTRQAFTTASSARWTTEATADYYAALLALEAGDIGFEAFRTYLGRGDDDPWRDAVLARPETWARGANYVKGSLVWGELDRRVRLETNSSATMTDVLWRLNQQNDQVSNDDVLAALADVSSNEVAGVGEQYTETPSTADMWSRFEHRRAFDTDPPLMQYDVQQYRVTGPFRNQSFDSPPVADARHAALTVQRPIRLPCQLLRRPSRYSSEQPKRANDDLSSRHSNSSRRVSSRGSPSSSVSPHSASFTRSSNRSSATSPGLRAHSRSASASFSWWSAARNCSTRTSSTRSRRQSTSPTRGWWCPSFASGSSPLQSTSSAASCSRTSSPSRAFSPRGRRARYALPPRKSSTGERRPVSPAPSSAALS